MATEEFFVKLEVLKCHMYSCVSGVSLLIYGVFCEQGIDDSLFASFFDCGALAGFQQPGTLGVA